MANRNSKSNSKSEEKTKTGLLSAIFGVGRGGVGNNASSGDDSDDDESQEHQAEQEAKEEAEEQAAKQAEDNKAEIEEAAKAANKFVGSHDAAKNKPAASEEVRQAAREQLQAREAAKAEIAKQAQIDNARREAIQAVVLDPNVTGDVTRHMAELAAPRGQMKHGSRPSQNSRNNQANGPTKDQQETFQEALNRERQLTGQTPLNPLDIIAGKGAIPAPKATDLSQLMQSRAAPQGFENGSVVKNLSPDVRPLTLTAFYNQQKKEFEQGAQDAISNIPSAIWNVGERAASAYKEGVKDAGSSSDPSGFNQETKERHRFVNSRPYNPLGWLAQPLNEALVYPAAEMADDFVRNTRKGYYGGTAVIGELVEGVGLGNSDRVSTDIRGWASQIPGPAGRTFGLLNGSFLR